MSALTPPEQFGPQVEVRNYEGTVGSKDHITRTEYGLYPTEALAHLHGAAGELPGEHRNRTGAKWDQFLKETAHGIDHRLFITVDRGEEPRISEGNHRRDAAIEHGHRYVPVEIRHFGRSELAGTVWERHLQDREHGQ